MKVHRFFTRSAISGNEIRLDEPAVIHQMRDVFRLKKGDRVILLDNSGFEYETEIDLLTREEGVFTVLSKKNEGFTPKVHLHMVCALTKRTFEFVLEKGTELGVTEFTPLISERTEKQNINRERSEKIIQEAAEQSGKTVLPELHEPLELTEALRIFKNNAIAFDLTAELFTKEKYASDSTSDSTAKNIVAFIGPEGGWSDAERALFREQGIPLYSFGPQILRAETAAIAAATLLLL